METVARRLALPGIAGHEEDPAPVRQCSLWLTILGTPLCALLLLGLFGPPVLLAAQFAGQGRTVRGVVTNCIRGSKTTLLDFTYEVDGSTVHGREDGPAGAYEMVKIGDPVEVTYLPDYPKTCCTNYESLHMLVPVAVLVLACAALLAASLISMNRLRRQ
jgi:hypothetical protein